jgi:DNA-binding CsgD family transcriptional regulator
MVSLVSADDELLLAYLHAQSDPVVAVDSAGDVVLANEPAARLLGDTITGQALQPMLELRGIDGAGMQTVPLRLGSITKVHVLASPARAPAGDASSPLTASWPAARGLPPRLAETLAALFEGLPEKEIARRMGLSPHTVHDYVKTLYRRFRVQSRAELVALALRAATERNPTR